MVLSKQCCFQIWEQILLDKQLRYIKLKEEPLDSFIDRKVASDIAEKVRGFLCDLYVYIFC